MTLSQSMTNFDYIKIRYCQSKTATSNAVSIFISVNEFKTFCLDGYPHVKVGLLSQPNQNGYSRTVSYISDTQIKISEGYNAGSGTSSNNAAAIPIAIYGMK